MKKLFDFFTHRLFIVGLLLVIQLFVLLVMIVHFNDYFVYFYGVCILLSLLVVLKIVSGSSNPGYKIAWIIPILLFPIFGGLFYLMFGGNKLSKREILKMKEVYPKQELNLQEDQKTVKSLYKDNVYAFVQSEYITKNGLCPVYQETYTEYLNIGEVYFEKLIEELRKAKHFIFMEYFIIQPGKMWDTVLEILEEKVKAGVDVRVLYDDVGCIMTLPPHYDRILRKRGIKCHVFNPFVPVLKARLNNRDHRKITVIDGYVGFTGGINLADEYINEVQKHGHWKDNGLLIKGPAVWNFTVMFLSLFENTTGIHEDFKKFRPEHYQSEKYPSDGYIQPYGDNPLDNEPMGETVYMNLFTKATKTIYITTPYLIIDNEMITALTTAAKSGVDVCIITPGVPDKKMINEVTKGYYEVLISSGVRIYEYTPGFIHAKTVVVDSVYATVGTVNLDYRSLYLHFECGTWVYHSSTVKAIEKDILETLKVCQEISSDDLKNVGWFRKMKRSILRLFAPLM